MINYFPFLSVSLKNCLKGLNNLIPNIEEIGEEKLKYFENNNIFNLNQDESASIKLFLENSSLNSFINGSLQKNIQNKTFSENEKLKPFYPYLQLLLKSLNKLPKSNSTVLYKIENKDLRKDYLDTKYNPPRPIKNITNWEFKICS